MFKEKLKIDEVDKMIITLMQDNPEITHSEISEKVHKSQPAVGARIIKLKRKHLLEIQIGIDYSKVDIKLAKVEMLTKDVSELLERLKQCPFVLNAFKQSGTTNLCVLISAPDITTIDKMVDLCLRKDENVISVNVSYIIEPAKRLVFPINFEIENFDEYGCGKSCYIKTGEVEYLQRLIKESQEKRLKSEIEVKKD
ncbi:MAG: Lrp/AsnC family transcriptional regulator [Promethearchaeota archaeon]